MFRTVTRTTCLWQLQLRSAHAIGVVDIDLLRGGDDLLAARANHLGTGFLVHWHGAERHRYFGWLELAKRVGLEHAAEL